MRRALLEKLRCLYCAGPLTISNATLSNEMEVLEGVLECTNCGRNYSIKKGILDMLMEDDPAVNTEVAGNRFKSKERSERYNDSWLLSLPEGFREEHDNGAGQFDHHNFFQVLGALEIKSEDTVLDLGCGTTWTANELAKRSSNVIATDISVEKFIGLESAEVFIGKYGNYYDRVRLDMCRLPFNDESVDITVNEASIHHAPNLDVAMREISRVLKTGGKAVFVNEPMASLFDLRKPSERHGQQEREMYGWNENCYTIYEYYKALTSAGLKIEKIFFPLSVRYKLLNMVSDNSGLPKNSGFKYLKYFMGRFLAVPYSKSRLFLKITENCFFYLMLVWGLPFCAVTTKPYKIKPVSQQRSRKYIPVLTQVL